MVRLIESLRAWGTPEFRETLKRELAGLSAAELPLQQGLTTGSHALDQGHEAMIIAVTEDLTAIRVRAGIFYSSIIAGCSCADDPTPVDQHSEYCEVQIDIRRDNGEARVQLLTDDAGPEF